MEIDLKGNVIFLICYEVVIKGAGQNTSCLSEKSSQVKRVGKACLEMTFWAKIIH